MMHKTTAKIAPPMNIRVDMVSDKPKMIESSSSACCSSISSSLTSVTAAAAAVSDSSFAFPSDSGFKTSPIYFRISVMSMLDEEFS